MGFKCVERRVESAATGSGSTGRGRSRNAYHLGACLGEFEPASIRCQAGRHGSLELEDKCRASHLQIRYGIGNGKRIAVFDVERKGFISQDGCAGIEDLEKLFRGETVFEVGGDEELELTAKAFPHSAAAIDEILLNTCYFGDVKMCRNRFAIREKRRDPLDGILFQSANEIVERGRFDFHRSWDG